MDKTQRDRLAGSLCGLAAGDCLGAQCEGMRRREILRFFNGELTEIMTHEEQKWMGHSRPAGFWTDDTQLALALLEPILKTGGFNPVLAATTFAMLAGTGTADYSFGLMRGAGGGFREAARNLLEGVDWKKSGTVTAGNGAAMRIAPFGVIFRDEPEKMRKHVCESGIITHHDPRGIAAAAAVAAAASFAAKTKPEMFDPGKMLSAVFSYTRATEEFLVDKYADVLEPPRIGVEHHVSECIEPLAGYFDFDEDDAIKLIGQNADRRTEMGSPHPAGVFCLASVICAIYFFARHYSDFEKAVTSVVNIGGATDSTGAMVGGMAGALHGVSAIPERWSGRIQGYKQLLARAAAIGGDKGARVDIVPLIELERGLTAEDRVRTLDLAGR
ncbi:MAG: hypothetical protein E3J72_18145 [Planctomycetota bacterium]|nr:MAG: hypothetical protein E3J72_18145 [Planctomycetota bacterium]